MGRFDTFRILLPGALVTVLIDLVARILSWTPGIEAAGAADFVDFLEAPLPALVVSFSIGLVLYMLDPAYSAPEYWRGIPSEHLRHHLEELRSSRAPWGQYCRLVLFSQWPCS